MRLTGVARRSAQKEQERRRRELEDRSVHLNQCLTEVNRQDLVELLAKKKKQCHHEILDDMGFAQAMTDIISSYEADAKERRG